MQNNNTVLFSLTLLSTLYNQSIKAADSRALALAVAANAAQGVVSTSGVMGYHQKLLTKEREGKLSQRQAARLARYRDPLTIHSDDKIDDAELPPLEQLAYSIPKTDTPIVEEIKADVGFIAADAAGFLHIIQCALAPSEIKGGLKKEHRATIETAIEEQVRAAQAAFVTTSKDKNIDGMIEAQRKQESLYQALEQIQADLQSRIPGSKQQALGAVRTLQEVVGRHIKTLGKQKGDNRAAIGTAQQQEVHMHMSKVQPASVALTPKARPAIPERTAPSLSKLDAQALLDLAIGIEYEIGNLERIKDLTVEQQKEIQRLKNQLTEIQQQVEKKREQIGSDLSRLSAALPFCSKIKKEHELLVAAGQMTAMGLGQKTLSKGATKGVIDLYKIIQAHIETVMKQLDKTQPKKQKKALAESELIKYLLSLVAEFHKDEPTIINFVLRTVNEEDTIEATTPEGVFKKILPDIKAVFSQRGLGELFREVLKKECTRLEETLPAAAIQDAPAAS